MTTLPNEFPDAHSVINDLRLEYVVAIEGIVRSRPDDSINVKMKTGLIEVFMNFDFILLLIFPGIWLERFLDFSLIALCSCLLPTAPLASS